MNVTQLLPKGMYHDQIITAQGRVIDLGWHSNIVVDRCRNLLAGFMKGDPGVSRGIQLLLVGKGLESWDIIPPPSPLQTDQQLTDPNPITISIDTEQIEYLDDAGVPAAGPTPRIQVAVTLGPGTPPVEGGETTYPLREFGLFGIFQEVEYMIDYVRHPVIRKQAGDTLVRTIRLVF